MDIDPNTLGPLVLHQGQDPIDVDIIAVHGPNGHRERSWTKGDVNWPRDLLPNDLPHARILSYGYDAFTRGSGKLACLSLYRLGQNLVADLASERARSSIPKDRPIVFVAHSLGGLVLKEGLVDAFLKPIDNDIRAVELATSGIIFLGTPHRGSPFAGHLEFITNILSLVAYTNNVAVKDLVPNAAPSTKALEQYDTIREHGRYEQVCFYEVHATSVGRFTQVVLVPEASAVINGSTKRAMHKDHVELVKFDTAEDSAYVALRDEIVKMAEAAPARIMERLCTNGKLAHELLRPLMADQGTHVYPGTGAKTALSLFDIPPFQVPNFVDRPDLMERIKAAFKRTLHSPSGSIIATLLGMGGQGKTQLGVEICRRLKREGRLQAIFWMDATTRASVVRGMEGIAKRLLPNQTFNEGDDTAIIARDTLRDSTSPWLLVFDGYDMLNEFSDLHYFFPQSHLGSILITSRHRSTEMLGKVIEVDHMETQEGLRLLVGSRDAMLSADEREAAHQILALLGGLPLAIDQARAYILTRRLPLARFLSEYSARKAGILRETPQLSVYRRRLPQADKETILSVFTTLELSLSQLRDSGTSASMEGFLTLLAFYHSTNIGEEIFSTAIQEESPADSFFDENGWNHLDFESAVIQMQSLSLLQFVYSPSEEILLSLHPLVSDWLKLRISATDLVRYHELARRHFETYLANNDADITTFHWKQHVLLHLDLLCSLKMDDSGEDVLNDFHYTSGRFYHSCGMFAPGEEMYKRALAGYEKRSGWNNPSTLNTANNLGILYRSLGRLEEAEDMYKRALAGFEKILGPEHISTLDTMNNLGIVYRDQGRLEEAEMMYSRALAGTERVLGPDHTSTLRTVDNLGVLYSDRGCLEEAEEMHKRALAGFEKTLGLDQTSTLITLGNLGIVYRHMGRLKEAEETQKRALAGLEKVLGPDHTSTLSTANNLGLLYSDMGLLEVAEEMFKSALAGREKVLGPNHAATLGTVNNLGALYYNQGRLNNAEEMCKRALTGREKTLGLDHTSTLDSAFNLGLLYHEQGCQREAEDMLKRALAGYRTALGPDHASSLEVLDCLDCLHDDQSRADEAKQMSNNLLQSGQTSDSEQPSDEYHDCLEEPNDSGLL